MSQTTFTLFKVKEKFSWYENFAVSPLTFKNSELKL